MVDIDYRCEKVDIILMKDRTDLMSFKHHCCICEEHVHSSDMNQDYSCSVYWTKDSGSVNTTCKIVICITDLDD